MAALISVRRRLRAHPWLSAAVGAVVAASAGTGVYFATSSEPATAAGATTRVQTVSTGRVRQTVSATGTLAPSQQENLDFAVSGQVTGVAVSTGQTVRKGQTLATINSASLAASEAQARASVASAQAKVDADAGDAASSTQTAADQAALAAAQNQLASAQAALAEATLTSPIDGLVAEVNLTQGQYVSGNASGSGGGGSGGTGSGGTGSTGSTGSGQSAATGASSGASTSPQVLVISSNSWLVNATVDANSVGLIAVHDQAQLTVTGANATVYGTVATIGLVSSSTSGTASYPVVVDVTGAPSSMHDGADVTATIIYKQVSGVVVPALAVHRTSTGSEYVDKVVNGKVVQTTVRTGLSSGGQTQVTAGLAEGDQIQVSVPQVSRTNGTTGRTGTGTTGRGGTGSFGGAGVGGGFGGGFGGGGGGGAGTGGFGGGAGGGGAAGGAGGAGG